MATGLLTMASELSVLDSFSIGYCPEIRAITPVYADAVFSKPFDFNPKTSEPRSFPIKAGYIKLSRNLKLPSRC